MKKQFLIMCMLSPAIVNAMTFHSWIEAEKQLNAPATFSELIPVTPAQPKTPELPIIVPESPDNYAMIKTALFCIGYGVLVDYLTRDVGSYLYNQYKKFIGKHTMKPWVRTTIYSATIGALWACTKKFNTDFTAIHDTLSKT